MTPDLSALEALLAKATPGPWARERGSIYVAHEGDDHRAGTLFTGACNKEWNRANSALIVAAVNALPALIAYVRELESDRTRLAQINANMAKHDRVAALAMRERCAQACEERALIYDGLESGASTRYFSDKMRGARTAAEECAAAIRALEPGCASPA